MERTEFTPESIVLSVAHINEVCRYANGEQALPIQDPLLEQRHVNAIGRYFEYCQRALTDPGVIALIQRSSVGIYHPNIRYGYLLKINHEGARQISDCVFLLTEAVPPRLVYSAEKLLQVKDDMEKRETDWEEAVKITYASRDGFNDWIFRSLEDSPVWRQLCGFRTMGAGDLLLSGVLKGFVEGIGYTFRGLRSQAEAEVAAARFHVIRDIDRIKEITAAFEQANIILDKAFNSQAESVQPVASRAKRGKKTPV